MKQDNRIRPTNDLDSDIGAPSRMAMPDAEREALPHTRNEALVSTRLHITEWYSCELASYEEWDGELSAIWSEGGFNKFRDPTREELVAALAAFDKEHPHD